MKYKVVAAISAVLIIVGVASLGALLQDLSRGIRQDTYLGATMAGWFLVGGGLLYWSARKRYSVGWRMYLGAFLMFFGFVGASVEADSIVNLSEEEPVFGFVLAAAFVVAGFLLARSGYWQNLRRVAGGRDEPAQAASLLTRLIPVCTRRRLVLFYSPNPDYSQASRGWRCGGPVDNPGRVFSQGGGLCVD